MQKPSVLKKLVIVIIGLFAFGALGGVFLAGLNMFNRAISTQEQMPASEHAPPQERSANKTTPDTPDKKP